MMKNIAKLVFAFVFVFVGQTFAQQTNSGYFTDGYLYRHQMNPAFGNNQDYFSFPALGNLSFALNGNLALKDLIYNVNGQTTTFMNPGVSLNEFMKNIEDKNTLNFTNRIGIISVGFKSWGGYNTIDINLRDEVHTNIPGSLFYLAKAGLSNQTYDITNFSVSSTLFAELALGHSRQIDEHWRVGGKLKVLFGGENINAHFNKATITLGTDAYVATTNAEVEANVKGLEFQTTTTMRGPEGQQTAHTYVNGVKLKNPGLGGWGLAFDLGGEFKLNDDWRFSLAALDLGFISWSNSVVASTNGDKTFTTDQYIFNIDKDASNSFKSESERLVEGVARLYELDNNGDQGSTTKAMAATINAGVEYCCPFYRPLTFGLMNATRINGDYTWTDFRLSANCAPLKWLAGTVDFGYGTFGPSFGWLLNIHPTGFNFFCGMDYLLGKVTKNGIPLNSNVQLNIGINFPLD